MNEAPLFRGFTTVTVLWYFLLLPNHCYEREELRGVHGDSVLEVCDRVKVRR